MNHAAEPEKPAEQDNGAHDHRPPRDPYLASLVKLVDDNPGWEIGLTLHVNGVIVSGLLCSMISFFEEQAEIIRQPGQAETAEGRLWFAEVFDSVVNEIKGWADAKHVDEEKGEETGAALGDLPAFIHLRAATVHAPGTDAVLPEVLWRGRLDHVSGWSIGNLGPKSLRQSRTAAEDGSAGAVRTDTQG
jgi:hypothetical protein